MIVVDDLPQPHADTKFVQAHRDLIAFDLNPNWRLVERTEDGDMWMIGDLKVIWSIAKEEDGRRWIHVSASRPTRLPSYNDMKRVKSLFIGDSRPAYSVYAPHAEHVNIHSNCLHLWAPFNGIAALPDFSRGTGSI